MTDAIPENAGISAGDWLRSAREAEGLSIEAVAQQLKLAPRQVRALEDGNFAELPGRTFVRGFVRNYARVLRLDPEAVVAALPGTEAAPALEGPTIGSTSRPMGELPATQSSRGGSWSRWAIPLALVAAVLVAAGYEVMRPGTMMPRTETKSAPRPVTADPVAPAPASGTPLPNPTLDSEPAKVDPLPQGAPPAPAPAPAAPVSTAPAPVLQTGMAGVIGTAASPVAAPAAAEPVLVIHYRGSAWTQVKDATGQVLLLSNGEPGTAQTVRGKPPLDVILGDASAATLSWRGQPFDIAPHVRANVARVKLP